MAPKPGPFWRSTRVRSPDRRDCLQIVPSPSRWPRASPFGLLLSKASSLLPPDHARDLKGRPRAPAVAVNARSLISICLATVSVLAGCGRDAGEFLQSGKGFLAAKDEAGALIQFKNAVDRAPDHPEARFLHARSLRRTGNPTAAETEFRKALSLGFDRVLVVPELAATLNEMGQSAKTLAETDAFQSADPSVSAEVAVLRGDALLLQGQTANARAEYARALGLAPRAPAPRVASARLALRDGDLAGAARTLEEVLRESPGHAAGLLTLATVRLKQGQAEAAVAALDRLAAAEPSDLRA